MIKVSVIIPVYNAGERLKACLDSLVGQSLKDIELIFVLDCPTDGSDLIVKDYAKKKSNIIVVENEHNINIGQSRNKGLELAQGEYVAFCDHDDIVMDYMYEEMYNKGYISNADVVLGVPEYRKNDGSLGNTYYYPEEGDIREKLLPYIIGKDETMPQWRFYFSHGVIWDNIYKREFLNHYQIRFVDNNKVTFEDNLFLIECLIHANHAIVYNKLMYIHTIDDNNTASSSGYVKTEKVVNYIHCLNALLYRNGVKERYRSNFHKATISYLKSCLHKEFKRNGYNFYRDKKLLHRLSKDNALVNILRDATMSLYIADSRNLVSRIINILLYSYLTK